jgi:hypothetical protein
VHYHQLRWGPGLCNIHFLRYGRDVLTLGTSLCIQVLGTLACAALHADERAGYSAFPCLLARCPVRLLCTEQYMQVLRLATMCQQIISHVPVLECICRRAEASVSKNAAACSTALWQ